MPDGGLEVITGVASIGQGVETVIAQICADTLGIDYANIRVSTARPTALPAAWARSPRA